MKINVMATGVAPDYYLVNGETITVFLNGESEDFDLSELEEGDQLASPVMMDDVQVIRQAVRASGELQVTLSQRVDGGMWEESGFIDSSAYDPDGVHIKPVGNVTTRESLQ